MITPNIAEGPTLISYEQALEIIIKAVRPLEANDVPLERVVGAVLAEDVVSDVDLPPFDKSAMDGYAVCAAEVQDVPAELAVVETVNAGQVPSRAIGPGECARIMTGAPVPEGADAVVMVEHTEPMGSGRVRILEATKPGLNICRKGEDMKRGRVALRKGTVLGPAHVAVLAAVGRWKVRVYRRPKAAFLATGNEVVDIRRSPGPGQIRDCNSYSISVRLKELGIEPRLLGIAPDDRAALAEAMSNGLRSDLFIVSGGVSMGDLDLVPQVLKELGVEILFHKVAIKPGKPVLFGKMDDTVVFGLPGNPVSNLVIAELMLVPAVKRMMGYPDPSPRFLEATLDGTLAHKADRRSFKPVVLEFRDGGLIARPVEYHGSADIVGFAEGDAIAEIPVEVRSLGPGSRVRVVPLGRRGDEGVRG